MKCPKCVEEGKTSQVFPGMSLTTAMGSIPYYDEQGKYHNHDPNKTTTDYRCSNGHQWTEETAHTCWCGWRGDGKTVVEFPVDSI